MHQVELHSARVACDRRQQLLGFLYVPRPETQPSCVTFWPTPTSAAFCHVVINEKAHQLRVGVENFLADRHPDDLVLVYLSCHGLVDDRRRLYFAPRDTLKHRLASSGVESQWLLEQLEDCRARRQVVILDCCFSGAFARGAAAVPAAGSTEPPIATSEVVPDNARRRANPAPRRTMLLATLGAGLAAAAALVTVLVMQAREDPGSAGEDNGNDDPGASSSGTFAQESPWRLRVRGVDVVGCDVMLTHDQSGNVYNWDDLYGIKTFQMRESGTFRYQVNDPGCRLLPQQGDGGLSQLPFSWDTLNGDTPVSESPGAVTVGIENRYGTPQCDLWLMSDADGRPIDNREAANQTSVQLESNGRGRVYIAATTCSIRVSATP